MLDAFGSGTWPVGAGPVLAPLATLRVDGCWRRMAAAGADDETERAVLMHP